MIHFEIIRILSISFIAYLFYKIFTGFDNNGKHVNKKDDENEKQIIEFDDKDLQTDFNELNKKIGSAVIIWFYFF